MLCDGCSTYRNEYVLGYTVPFADDDLSLVTKCIGNFKISGGHSASDVSRILNQAVRHRLGKLRWR